MKFDLSLTVS